MDRTDRHFRYLMRLITRRTLLYTEMVTTGAVLHGDTDHLLGYSQRERPLALQLGGDDPAALAECARIAEDRGYDEVNLNVGCPSNRVQKGSFGACLMATPGRVADAVAAMRAAVSLPVTVKHRIGIDDLDRYEDMERFVRLVAEAGCDQFTVHARKAWLQGLSPKQNRTVPPLRYADVHRLKQDHPGLCIELNGGIRSLTTAHDQLDRVDAVMVGRMAYDTPYAFAEADRLFFGDEEAPLTRGEVAEAMVEVLDGVLASGGKALWVVRHMLNLFAGMPGARAWRRALTEQASAAGARPTLLRDALARVPEASRGLSAPAEAAAAP